MSTENETETTETETTETETINEGGLGGENKEVEMSAEEKAAAASKSTDDQSSADSKNESSESGKSDEGAGKDEGLAGKSEDEESAITAESFADLSMPEGVEVDDAYLGSAKNLFAELKLTTDQAQKLLDFQSGQAVDGEAGRTDAFEQMTRGWLGEAKTDKEFGGDKFNESMAVAKAGLNRFGTPELTKLLHDFGVDKHPEVIRAFWKIAQLTQEDNPGGAGGESPNKGNGDWADQMYDTDKAEA